MRFAVVALLVFVAVSRSDFLLPFSLSNDLIEYTARLESSNDSICNVAQLNYCQYTFNSNFGLNSSISYNNGSSIFRTIQDYLNSNVTQINKVCKARTNFYHCLGHSYYSCMNLNSRLESNDTDSSNGFDYIRTFRGLEWICGGGFKQVINQWNCFDDLPTTAAYKSCMTNFNQTISTSHFCPAVQQTGDCLNRVYRNGCDSLEAGHYGCENFRFTFDKACPGLQCSMANITLIKA